MRSLFASVLFLSFILLPSIASFTLNYVPGGRKVDLRRFSLKVGDLEFSTEEVNDMEQLIVSLSMERTDESRRKKVEELFHEEFSKPNEEQNRFAALFDAVLMVAGERVQSDARRRALEKSFEKESPTRGEPAKEEERKGFMDGTNEERQLWAMVDLMVQTKTIVKKARG
mmetsp:Transcript_24834/g.36746  ORF Transcript_24834/g.36746 Transcript_24834/m.36746 type:complete len:170 (+) Transcript_24834:109-618(+)|eukprot:CAMPEP_0194214894 /NCGR_PEP_ID=MMETSP0156-20130528/16308_1 /TAXON_ID=33649 /ORGANISM="Thalassionema nitzschioides, Strain L26-B" /LENGTH=169 /DNA_ID=CAMNT_0038943255 /DNA_START=82 /DNA_END=591 /DNA_ORIENTATION=+